MNSLTKLSLSTLLLRPVWVLVLVLFSFQIVSASLSQTQCHESPLHEHASVESMEHTPLHACEPQESSHTSSNDGHCNDFGFCSYGHCHVNHCSVVLLVTDMNYVLFPESLLGLGTENKLVSLLDLDKPWQPPRA